eukprot:GHVL01027706.1.p1 GENE.GHVL01027706.1~~GHVL01027706.1.p1  ORF type:complete len:142 (+),score=34.40 GHVL01027706.1:51-476(+)
MKIESEVTFCVPSKVLFETFLSSSDLTRMSRGAPAVMDGKEGGKFSLFGGSIEGENVKIVQNELIEQKWRFRDWEEGVYSCVQLKFERIASERTKLKLEQNNIPSQDKHGNVVTVEKTISGWKVNFWDPINKILGYPKDEN